jgi:hypothetical protein
MGRQNSRTDDAADELDGEQAYEQIAARLADADGSTEVTEEELVALDVLKDYEWGSRGRYHVASAYEDDTPIVAQGSKDVDPVDYYLVRVASDKWLNLKCLRKLIDRDGGSKWVATDAGEIEVSGRPLQDGWDEDIVGHDDETLAGFEDAYVEESEMAFTYVDEMLGVTFNGSTVYMESPDPWFGWDSIADNLGVDKKEFAHEIQPAIASGRPRGPRILDTTMTAEYSVSVEFTPEVSDE